MNASNDTDSTTPAAETTAPVNAPALPRCANCGAQLHGAHCYACGQPVKGMIRPLSSMLADVADTIFNIDSRLFRTLIPLYFRPGYLSNEYFAGRRVRYVTPFRLYFFLSIAAFLLMQVSLDSFNFIDQDALAGANVGFSAATTAQQVEKQRDEAIAALAATGKIAPVPSLAMSNAQRAIRESAAKRLAELKAAASVPPDTKPPDTSKQANPPTKQVWLGEGVWDPQAHPIQIDWLPAFANVRINRALVHLHDNLSRIKQNPQPFFIGTLGVLPGVLFVLMPLFALLLKIFYLFKRRLYMEHLIVALHSHSFIFVSLIFLVVAGLGQIWAASNAPWLAAVLGLAIVLMGWWIPLYLLLMQKKVYKQGWFLTVLKYCIIGTGYTILIALGIGVAFVVSLATT